MRSSISGLTKSSITFHLENDRNVLNPDPVQTSSIVLHNQWQIFAVGCFGGIAGDVFAVLAARHGRPPEYLRQLFFWVSAVLLAVLGGVFALLYGFQQVQAFLVIHIGASAPVFFQSLATAVPKRRRPRIG